MEHLRTLATAALHDNRGCNTTGDVETHNREDAGPQTDGNLSDATDTVVQLTTNTTTTTENNALVVPTVLPSRSSKRKLDGGHDNCGEEDELALVEEGGEGRLATEDGLREGGDEDQSPSKRARKSPETEADASTDPQVSADQSMTVAGLGVDDAARTPTTSHEEKQPAAASSLVFMSLRSDHASLTRYPDQQLSSTLPPAPATHVSSAVRPTKAAGPVCSTMHALMRPVIPSLRSSLPAPRRVLPKGGQPKVAIPADPTAVPFVPPLAALQQIQARQAHLLSPLLAGSPTVSPLITAAVPPSSQQQLGEHSNNKAESKSRKRRKARDTTTSSTEKKVRRTARPGAEKQKRPAKSAVKGKKASPTETEFAPKAAGLTTSSSPGIPELPVVVPLSEEARLLLPQISIGLPEQVIYWGQSKAKCDVTATVSIPAKLHPMLNIRALCTAHIPIDKNAKTINEEAEEDEPLTEEDRKTALLVLKRQSEAEYEYEVVFKQCINNKRLSNLTLVELVFTLFIGGHAISRIVPLVTYTHSKAITRACCRLLWYPTSEKESVSVADLLTRLETYHQHHLGCNLHSSERTYFQSRLTNQENVVSYEEFYGLIGEWFVLAVKLAKKKKQYLWQQGDKSFVPMLINPVKENPSILKEPGDFVVYVGEDTQSKKGSNSLPALTYPLQITYISPDGTADCMGVENKLDKLTGFIHEKRCLRNYVVLGHDGQWVHIAKEKFAFNAAQLRRWETTGGETCVVGRAEGQCASYAHSN